jgi:hypothetical protein
VIIFLVVLGAMVLIAAIAIGAVIWLDRREIADKQGKPICGCDHHRAMHDPKTNECHGKDYEGDGRYVRSQAPCRRRHSRV